MGFLEKFGFKKNASLEKGVEKSRNGLLSKLGIAIAGRGQIDDAVLDELEEILITSDVGVKTTLDIIGHLKKRVSQNKYVTKEELNTLLRDEIIGLLMKNPIEHSANFDAQFPVTPHIILVVGVNGVGKTTTIGKLAHGYKSAGKSVLLGAADTFRAAAVDQLKIWSERADVPIIEQGQNADPAAVAFDTVSAAKARGADIGIIDTAGRLHNKKALMDELSKIKRVLSKVVHSAPHEVLLVLDASTGQNALQQARAFTKAVDISGLVLTKLDGTAKGGIVLGVSHELSVPVKYIGLGESLEDLQVFDKEAFVYALFGE